jgi:hypothetical protein
MFPGIPGSVQRIAPIFIAGPVPQGAAMRRARKARFTTKKGVVDFKGKNLSRWGGLRTAAGVPAENSVGTDAV